MPEPRLFFLTHTPRTTPSREFPPGWQEADAQPREDEKHA